MLISLLHSSDVSSSDFCRHLTREGYQIEFLNNLCDLVKKQEKSLPDIILLDIDIPQLSAYQQQINNLSKNRQIPVILLYKPEHYNSPALFTDYASDYITYPVNHLELLVKIKKQIQLRSHLKQVTEVESRYTVMMENMPVPIIYTDLELNIFNTNKQFHLLYGYQKEELNKLDQILIFSEQNKLQNITHWFEEIKNKNFDKQQEVVIRHKSGEKTYCQLSSKLINPKQPELGIVWVLTDINEYKHVKEDLKLAASVFDVSGEPMIIMDGYGHIINTNPATEKLSHYKTSELIQQPISKLFDYFGSQADIRPLLIKKTQQHHWKGELWLQDKMGNNIPTLVTINCIKREDNSINHYIALINNISEHKENEKELKHRANHDSLTGLVNRNIFFTILDDVIAVAKRNAYTVAILYCDLDGFKAINDTLGHGKGDTVLQQVANILNSCVREIDTVARVGGDEFVIILNGTSEADISETADRLINAINTHFRESLKLTISFGIALFPQDSECSKKLLQYADQAMYKAKERGKNSYCWHNPNH